MSSELLEVDDDENGSTVLLSMKASGDAFIYANGELVNYYHLSPNEMGWKNAAKIVSAINSWIDHTRKIAEQQIAPRYYGIVIEKSDCCALRTEDKEYELRISGCSRQKEPWMHYVGKQLTIIGNIDNDILFSIGISYGNLTSIRMD